MGTDEGKAKTEDWTEWALLDLLARHYGQKTGREQFAWAFLPHVANGTGGRKSRTVDGIAMGLWPSRGMEIHGFEVKVARGDWRRELEDPGKAEDVFAFFDRFWIVAPKGIVRREEMPPTWGLMVPHGGRLVAEVDAPKLSPKEVTRAFVAAVLRRVSETKTPKAQLEAEYKAGRDKAREEAKEEREYEVKSLKEELDETRKAVAAFEKASGIGIHATKWATDPEEAARMGEAVRLVRKGAYMRERERLEGLAKEARRIAEAIERELENAKMETAERMDAKAPAPQGARA